MHSDFYQQVRLATCLVRTAYSGAAIIIAVILGCSFLSLNVCEMHVYVYVDRLFVSEEIKSNEFDNHSLSCIFCLPPLVDYESVVVTCKSSWKSQCVPFR